MTSSENANSVKRFSRRQFLKTGTAAAVVVVVAGIGGFVATQAPQQPEAPSRARATSAPATTPAPAPTPTPAVKSFTFTVQDKQSPWALVMNGEANPTITVNVGDTVEINFTNDGQLPHTWTLNAGSPAPYDVNLRVLTAESDTINFVADKPGTFSYYCAIAGHRDLGMTGEIIILG